MYAIISADGRQYRVTEGQELEVDYRDVSQGAEIKFERVLALGGPAGTKVGAPTVTGAVVTAEVLGTKMGVKLVIQKYRKRKNYRRRTGHRQMYTNVRIKSITGV